VNRTNRVCSNIRTQNTVQYRYIVTYIYNGTRDMFYPAQRIGIADARPFRSQSELRRRRDGEPADAVREPRTRTQEYDSRLPYKQKECE
jgi:hypothetical protein